LIGDIDSIQVIALEEWLWMPNLPQHSIHKLGEGITEVLTVICAMDGAGLESGERRDRGEGQAK